MSHSVLKTTILVLLLALASGNAVQGYRIRRLTQAVDQLAWRHSLHEGDVLPAFISLNPRGEREEVVRDRPAKPVLLYWMSPTCPWCARNEANFRTVVAAVRDRYDVIAVSATFDGLARFASESQLSYRLVGPPVPEVLASYKFAETPMTIVLSRDRHVERVWHGVYDGKTRDEVERFFSTTLPGLLY
jgi:peroxiredoxin